MFKVTLSVLLFFSLNAIAGKRAPIDGECKIGAKKELLQFPTGTGSKFPIYDDAIMLSVFAMSSENLTVDEKGFYLFDISIDSSDREGNGLGTIIFRNLSSHPKVKREFSYQLKNNTFVNCKF